MRDCGSGSLPAGHHPYMYKPHTLTCCTLLPAPSSLPCPPALAEVCAYAVLCRSTPQSCRQGRLRQRAVHAPQPPQADSAIWCTRCAAPESPPPNTAVVRHAGLALWHMPQRLPRTYPCLVRSLHVISRMQCMLAHLGTCRRHVWCA